MKRILTALVLVAATAATAATAACGDDAPAAPTDAPPTDALPAPDADTRLLLSAAGLYDDIATLTLAPDAVEYAPSYELWSDGADKRRFLLLPAGTQLDTSDFDRWRFPVGTRLFKEFSRDGRRLETRLIERLGPGDGRADYFLGSFVWLPDGSDAVYSRARRENVLGTTHDVPSAAECNACHDGEPGRVLGLSALQLDRPGAGVTLAALVAAGVLSHPPPPGDVHGPPGDAPTAAALGALHANCGHCHNPSGTAWVDTDMTLRLFTSERDPAMTALYTTTLGVPLSYWSDATIAHRILPGDPTRSAVAHRMGVRDGSTDQMPPSLATEVVDGTALAQVAAWIAGL